MTTIKIIRQAEILPSLWAGGKTTQLLIFPEKSSYSDRDFAFRISTATVETEISTFTHLQGVKRSLMILQGSMNLEHKGRYTKKMEKFEVDNFLGDWESRSYGKVIDFNLMTMGQANGFLESVKLEKNSHFLFQNEAHYQSIVYYVWKGAVELSCEYKQYTLQEQELICFQNLEKNAKIEIKAEKYTELIGAFIHH